MREILFRGKTDAIHSKWVYGYYERETYDDIVQHIITDGICTGTVDSCTSCAHVIIPETLGQFTGLTDKNGKKIFEGDIAKFTDSPFGYVQTGEVVFHEGAFCIMYKCWGKTSYHRIGQREMWQDMGASGELTYSYEILGNVHDNPEMIE